MIEYRLLNDGEEIQEGDEFYHGGEWRPISSSGEAYKEDIYQPHRRPISEEQVMNQETSNQYLPEVLSVLNDLSNSLNEVANDPEISSIKSIPPLLINAGQALGLLKTLTKNVA